MAQQHTLRARDNFKKFRKIDAPGLRDRELANSPMTKTEMRALSAQIYASGVKIQNHNVTPKLKPARMVAYVPRNAKPNWWSRRSLVTI